LDKEKLQAFHGHKIWFAAGLIGMVSLEFTSNGPERPEKEL
jgi:hypothetical protein